MNRTQKILLGLLAIQALGIFLFQGPLQSSTSPPERRALFPGVDELEISRVSVVGPEDEKRVTLVREGDAWGIQEAGGYPADPAKIDKLLEGLGELEVRRPVVTSSRYHKALKVTDAERERHVSLFAGEEASPSLELYLGTSPNYQTTHIRRADEDAVYEVRGLGAYDVRDTPSGWISAKLLDVPGNEVTGIRVQNGKGSFELERMADGGWQAVQDRQRVLEKSEVDSLVRAAASINAAEPEGPLDRASQGLDSPAATVTLRIVETPEIPGAPEGESENEGDETEANEAEPVVREVTVWVGGLAGENDDQRYVAHSDFGFAARAWKGSLDRLVDATLEDLEPGESEG